MAMVQPRQACHVVTTRREYKGKVYEQHLLRHTYREDGKVKNETLANLTPLGPELVALVRAGLQGKPVGVLTDEFEVVQSWHHGHVQTVLVAMQRLGIADLIAPRPSRQRALVMLMIAARLLAPRSKLATLSWARETTVLDQLGIEHVDEDALYEAMDWLREQQPKIEKRLADRHLHKGGLALYDLSSTYVEGRCCPLAALGHNRDGKKGKLQVNFGLLTDADGRPVAIDVLRGNTADPTTVLPQVEKMQQRFDIDEFTLVGDRAMISKKLIAKLEKDHPGVRWISALRTQGIRELVTEGRLQLGLFDERNLVELEPLGEPGERMVACRNPDLAKLRAHKRQDLLAATETALGKLVARIAAGRLKGKDKIGVAVGKVINKYKMAKHFVLDITDNGLGFARDQAHIDAEAGLDGIYVVRTTVPKEKLSADDTVRTYKRLAQVEHAFRSLKSVDLHVRPLHHYTEERVRAHIFLCMLAYYVQWHLERALAPLTFADEAPAQRSTRDPVAPARPTEATAAKAATKRNADDDPVHALRSVLANMATIVRNRIRRKGGGEDAAFDLYTTPSAAQRQVLQRVEAIAV